MSDLPSSQDTSTFAASPEEMLQTGLTALKQKEYAKALQYLSPLPQNRAVPGAVRLKARIGLVQALRGDGQLSKAIALCQKLAAHPQTKVQQWAEKTLISLQQQNSPPSSAALSASNDATGNDPSGFQPITSAAANKMTVSPPSETVSETASGSDLSGFQPLDQTAAIAPPTPTSDIDESHNAATGNIDEPAKAVNSTGNIDKPTEAANSTDELSSPLSTTDSSQSEQADSQSSLFHYERLNQTTPATSATTDAATLQPAQPSPQPPPAAGALTSPPTPLQFRYGGRLERPRSLPRDQQAIWQVWGSLLVSAIALFWVCRRLIQWLLGQFARFLDYFFDRFVPIPLGWRYDEHTFLVLFCLAGLLLATPWLLDWLFTQTAGLQSLSIQKLKQNYPESCRLLRRIAQKHGWVLPTLRELPTEAPLIFSYGWLPRYSRIVVSRGLLARLDDEELATLMGYELSHLTRWTLPLMSLIGGLLQLCYQGYWQTARWGDRRTDRASKVGAVVASTICYGLFWIVRKIAIPFSRSRGLDSDRQAVEWTGNPNALTRALVKLADGLAEAIAQAGHTPPLIESTDLLTPCGYELVVNFGSLYPDAACLEDLYWDIQNPYRRWLSINGSHPRLGERLKRLTGYALRWQLVPELPFPESAAAATPSAKAARHYWLPFLQQISPYVGPLCGVAVAMLLWFLGGVFEPLGLRRVAWVYGDRSVLWGSLLLGLGMGIMVRINPYFPDITTRNRLNHPNLSTLLQNPLALPTDSQPVRLAGQLLGRTGMANWLCQDLMLKTTSGLIRLHFLSLLGAFGNLLIHPQHPTEAVGQTVEVQGWYRKGAIAWIDIDYFSKKGKGVVRANHPMFAVLLSLGFCALGLYVLLRG